MSNDQNRSAQLLLQEHSVSGLVEIWQDATQRWLCIDGVEQSRIDRHAPHIVQSPVHQSFLLPLLFLDSPAKVMLGGLGGGVIVNALNHIDSNIQGDAIEIDTVVAEAAREHFNMSGDNWTAHISDIRDWQGKDYDIMYIDIAEQDCTPDWLVSESMIKQFKQQLSSRGLLVMNLLVEDSERFREILLRLRNAFDRRTVCVGFDDHWNIIVMAFNSPPDYPADELEQRCECFRSAHDIDLSQHVDRMRQENPSGSGVF